MFFNKILHDMIDSDSNPVNRMYLHEINLKWNEFQKLIDLENVVSNDLIIEKLNAYKKALTNNKYKYNKYRKNGFKKDSPIFSAKYLEDVINLVMQRNSILSKKGIVWGHIKFSTKIRYEPRSIKDIDKQIMIHHEESPEFLMLHQQIECQYRISGKRNYYKYKLKLPLLVFHVVKNFSQKDFLQLDLIARQAKDSFAKAKIIIVCETLDKGFLPSLENAKIDGIFIMEKAILDGKYRELQVDILNALELKINEFISEKRSNAEMILKKGYIE